MKNRMKFSNFLNEDVNISPFIKILRLMNKKGIGDEMSEIWDFLSNELQIKDLNIKLNISELYKEYYGRDDEDFRSITSQDLLNITDISDIDDEQIALSLFLNVNPLQLERQSYRHYELIVYKNTTDDEEWAIGEDWDAKTSMEAYFDGYVDEIGVENLSDWVVRDFIEIEEYSVRELAHEEAEARLDDMDEDEIIEEAGYNKDHLLDSISEIESENESIDDEIFEIESEITDLMDDNEEGENDSEIESLRAKVESLNILIDQNEDKKSDLEREIEDLYTDAKGELLDKYIDEIYDEIEGDGVEWFTSRGWSYSDAINGYFDFDQNGLERHLAETEDRGQVLSTYDGTEEEIEFEGTYYYIYRIN